MASIQKFSEYVIDYAERLSDVADAAQGKGSRRGSSTGTRWLVLPAAGAGLFALVKSDFFTRQAKGMVEEAKTRASDLPDDLLSHVRQTSQTSQTSRTGSPRTRTSSANGTTSSARKRSSARKSGSSRKTSSSAR
jgi:hypothetical protein